MAKKRAKKNPFKAGLDHMLRVSGVDCQANIGGMPTTFKGIFDELATVEVDGGQEVLIRESTLTVKRSMALSLNRNLPIDVRVEKDKDPLRWVISDIIETGDGTFVELKLRLRKDVPNDEQLAYEETEFDAE